MNGRVGTLIAVVSGALSVMASVMAHAQAVDFTLPPNTLIPNYNRVPVGQREALEGGAFVARTNDAGANWYNPAGLAWSEKTAINAAANAYELIKLSLEGVGVTERSTRFAQIGTFFGGVIGKPIIHSRALRLGFAYARPVSWSPGGIDASLTASVPPGSELLGVSASGSFVSVLGGVAAGLQVAERLRVGLGLNLAVSTLHQNQAITDRLIQPTSAITGLRAVSTDGSSQEIVVTAGVQWNPMPSFFLGLLAAPPSLRFGGSSTIVFQNSAFAASGSSDLTFLDQDATFRYKLPARINVGGAFQVGRGEVELDVRYYGGFSPYEMFSSEARALLLRTDAVGVPTLDSIPFVPVLYDVRSVVNVAAGGHYAFSRMFRLHAGIFTDNSPVNGGTTAPFRSVDLTGISTGVTLAGSKLSGSLGLTASWGTAAARPIGPTLGGLQAATTVKLSTFNLLYSFSYVF